MDTNNTKLQAHIDQFIAKLTETAHSQLKYNVLTNVPAGRLKPEECVQNAFNVGLVSTISTINHWDIYKTREICRDLLEDVNDHDKAGIVHEWLR